MIPIRLKDYESVEFHYLTGTRYVSLIRYDYGHTWKLKIVGLRAMLDAFCVPDDDFYHSQVLAITHRDLLTGELGEWVNKEVNERFSNQLEHELVPF